MHIIVQQYIPNVNAHPGEDLDVKPAILSSRKLVFDVPTMAQTATTTSLSVTCV